MLKEIKKCYHLLDLPYDADIEKIKSRQKVLIKMYRAKGIRTGKSYKEKINEITAAGYALQNYVKENGVQKASFFNFATNENDVATSVFVLVLVIIICTVTFLILL